MTRLAVALALVAVLLASGAGSLQAAQGGCSGLLAFASNRSEDALPQIYRIGLDGRRTDVSRSIGSASAPAPSPDGSKVAFWSSLDGLVVADADGKNQRPLAALAGAGFSSGDIVWAPDSRRLAVNGYGISRVSSPPLVLVYDAQTGVGTDVFPGTDPHWSPDGTLVEYASTSANNDPDVLVARPDGTERRQIAHGRFVAWSPDGTRILGFNGSDSWVAPAGGGATVAIPAFEAQAWTPDSSRLIGLNLIVSPSGDQTLETVAADGSDSRVVAAGVRGPRLSPDGRRVVFVRQSDRHVVVTDLDGHIVRDFGTWDPWADYLHLQFQPSWSPDGTKILYWSGGKVVVADGDSGTLDTLAGGAKEIVGYGPVWSADGSSVFDDITDATGNTDIYVARPDGTGVHAVFADRVPEGGPAWSPDGRRLAFIRYGSSPSLVVTDLAGHARVLTTLPPVRSLPHGLFSPLDGPPAWSPEGKTIAVASSKGVRLVDVRSGIARPWRAPVGEGLPVAVAWSRQGAIATTDAFDDSYIWIVRKRSTWKVWVNDFYDQNYGDVTGLASNLTWSPDGTKLAFLRYGAEVGTGSFAWVFDSIRIIDKNTRKTRSSPIALSGFSWSPDGRHFIVGGFDTEIFAVGGKRVARLRGLRAFGPSWRPQCNHASVN